MESESNLIGVSIILGVLNIIILACFIILFVRIVKYVFKGLRSSSKYLNGGWLNLGISVGFTSLIYSYLIADIIYNFFSSIFRLFVDFSEASNSLWYSQIRRECENGITGDCIVVSSTGLLREWGEKIYSRFISDFLFDIPVQDFIAFLLITVILSLSIHKIIGAGMLETSDDALKNKRLKNLRVYMLIAVSIYFSLTAIVVVPIFSKDKQISESLSIQNLEADLKRYVFDLEEFNKIYPEDIFSNDSTLTAFQKSTIDTIRENSAYSHIQTLFEYSYSDIQNLNDLWQDVRDKSKKELSIDFNEEAKSAYNLASKENLGDEELITYYRRLLRWVKRNNDNIYLNLGNSYDELLRIDNSLNDADLMRWFISSRKQYKPLPWTEKAGEVKYALRKNLRQIKTEPVPDRPLLGEKFGIIRTFTSWLINTESMPLALIIGLFGFGLLGATASTFIRERREGKTDEELILSDFSGVIIRGFSAAIVVFLAVKGSLAVFSTDGSEVNPYALFFTCLIAAVFSEKIWAWAKNKLAETFSDEEKQINKN